MNGFGVLFRRRVVDEELDIELHAFLSNDQRRSVDQPTA
jgi:hypothetical protein